jgi:Carboxypeptidase regulatory-like domain
MTENRFAFVRLAIAAAIMSLASVQAQRMPMPRAPIRTDGLLVGRVVDTAGRPVAGAVVVLSRRAAVERFSSAVRMPAAPQQDRVLTRQDGFFVFGDLPLSTFTLIAAKPGYSEGAFGRRRPGGPAQELQLTEAEPRREIALLLWKHGAITGIVTDETGEPLIGIAMQSFRRTEVNGVRRFVAAARGSTDDRGIYRLPGLPPGDYVVATSSRQIAVPLSLADDSRDRGIVTPSDAVTSAVPMPGNASALQLGDTVLGLAADGPTPPPPEGDRIWVYPPAFHPAPPRSLTSATVSLRSGEDREGIDLQLRPVRTVRVSGFLSGPADMLALRRLRLVPAESDLLDAGEPVTSTDTRGRFVFPAVPAGEYSLRTTSRSASWRTDSEGAFYWADVPITVGPQDLDEVNVTLRPGAVLSGSLVFDGVSRPAARTMQQARVVIERANTGLPGSEAAIFAAIDDVGQFTASGLAAGFYFVRVLDSPVGWMFKRASFNGRDLSEYPVEVRNDLAGIAIEFTDRWTGLRGIVTTPTGQTDSAALVLLFPTDSSRWTAYAPGARRMRSARVAANGEFSFTSVPVGDYYFTAISDEDGADWQDPDVLDALSRAAVRITINDGDQKTVTVRRKDSRR